MKYLDYIKELDCITTRIALIVFIIEAFVMTVFPFMHGLPIWQEVIVDSSLLVLLSTPLIYFFVIAPSIVKETKIIFESNKAKSKFLGTVGHELRTPLNAIIGFSDIILDDNTRKLLNETQQLEYIKYINDSGRQLLDLINDILETAKGDLNEIVINEQETMLVTEILDPVCNMFKHEAKEKKLKLVNNIDFEEVELLIDPIKIRQVITNIISNAIKFSDSGEICVSSWINGVGMYITIEDQGPGIKEEELPNLFSPFFRTEDAAYTDGSGLGLSISKKIMDLHEGTISASSEVGLGSTFTIFIPNSRIIG